eukprot:GSChrysophyteH1.ASY1.ANO1.103.1 assembled CDS
MSSGILGYFIVICVFLVLVSSQEQSVRKPSDSTQKIEVGGESLGLSNLGPIIINKDGTTRRISNWDLLSKKEQDRTWERISKRNAERLSALKETPREHEELQRNAVEGGYEQNNPARAAGEKVQALPSGTETEEELEAALAEIAALNLDLDDRERQMPSMF